MCVSLSLSGVRAEVDVIDVGAALALEPAGNAPVSAARAPTGQLTRRSRRPPALGVLVRDRLLTPDEYWAMANGLADSTAPTTGNIAITDWIAANGDQLGRNYATRSSGTSTGRRRPRLDEPHQGRGPRLDRRRRLTRRARPARVRPDPTADRRAPAGSPRARLHGEHPRPAPAGARRRCGWQRPVPATVPVRPRPGTAPPRPVGSRAASHRRSQCLPRSVPRRGQPTSRSRAPIPAGPPHASARRVRRSGAAWWSGRTIARIPARPAWRSLRRCWPPSPPRPRRPAGTRARWSRRGPPRQPVRPAASPSAR